MLGSSFIPGMLKTTNLSLSFSFTNMLLFAIIIGIVLGIVHNPLHCFCYYTLNSNVFQ